MESQDIVAKYNIISRLQKRIRDTEGNPGNNPMLAKFSTVDSVAYDALTVIQTLIEERDMAIRERDSVLRLLSSSPSPAKQ